MRAKKKLKNRLLAALFNCSLITEKADAIGELGLPRGREERTRCGPLLSLHLE